MTIKPVNSNQKDKKEGHDRHGIGVNEQQNQQNIRPSQHRNVVIEGHGQSSQSRIDVYDELGRHRHSPHRNRTKRLDHNCHHKRERTERGGNSSQYVESSSRATRNSPEIPAVGQTPSTVSQEVKKPSEASGYNSGDEHHLPKEKVVTIDEWHKRDEKFAKCMADRGFVLRPIEEDGACLFRAISLQIYGDEDMHDVIRQQTMDYIYKNREYFSHFVTEDINSYIKRKRRKDSHGNHIEIQVMSEIYNRPVELYCYQPTPVNIFNSEQRNNGFAPLRLSYQRGSHYNAILDPYNATVGVGLGLPNYKPELQTEEAARISEQLEIEKTLFEDKLKTTDWDATTEAIEEQIARESYLQWCRENMQKSHAYSTSAASSSATVTSAEVAPDNRLRHSPSPLKSSNSNAPLKSVDDRINKDNTNNIKKDAIDQRGYDSDNTDMSSASSAGNNSENSIPSLREKKSKSSGNSERRSKKRRRELAANIVTKSPSKENPAKESYKSPKREVSHAIAESHSKIEDDKQQNISINEQQKVVATSTDQQPCTSKQLQLEKSTSQSSKPTQDAVSTFYRSLLESSYSTDGFGQLTESEMLQRAIQLSTEDYIEDQQKKIL